MFLYRICGIKKEWTGSSMETSTKKIYYYEASSFPKAVTKAKKVLDHIHEIRQTSSEILWDEENI